eukprot:m.27109 g.27109  ORF g.27109 m.27109 type:complete len:470 (+) comp15686_c0_seq1:239-1648(+)
MPPQYESSDSTNGPIVSNTKKMMKKMATEDGADQPAKLAWKVGGTSYDGTTNTEIVRAQPTDEKILIGVKGQWLNVTNYLEKHPGGDVLLEFAGKDATYQFLAYHPEATLHKFKHLSVGTYEWNPRAPDADPLDAAYLELLKEFTDKGYFETDMSWVAGKIAFTFTLWALCIGLGLHYANTGSSLAFYTGAACMAGFFQQCGFHMHDFMHRQVFHDRTKDGFCGWLFACCGFGVSQRWWRDEHNEHHLFTCSVVEGVGCSDPQMTESVWAQSDKLFAFFHPKFLGLLIRIQHLLFLPLLIFFGYFFLKLDSYIHERRAIDAFGCLLYWGWLVTLGMQFPCWYDALLYYYIASCLLGVLEIQLLVSHYSEEFLYKPDAKDSCWMRRQVDAVIDIDCPEFMDWFYGGLHLHAIHHLFPRMSRQFYRQAMPSLHRVLKEHDIKLKHTSFYGAIKKTILHLKHMNTLFSMDPR